MVLVYVKGRGCRQAQGDLALLEDTKQKQGSVVFLWAEVGRSREDFLRQIGQRDLSVGGGDVFEALLAKVDAILAAGFKNAVGGGDEQVAGRDPDGA
jgi:hypothetical protein